MKRGRVRSSVGFEKLVCHMFRVFLYVQIYVVFSNNIVAVCHFFEFSCASNKQRFHNSKKKTTMENNDEINDVLSYGLSIAGRDPSKKWNAAAKIESFRSLYGLQPETVIDILNDLQMMNNENRITRPNSFWFFVTLHWLRVYDVGNNILFTFGIGSKVTLRKYIRIYLKALQALCHSKVRQLRTF